ncbi:MAG: Zn-dependent exopeptidase M28 [bacterium]|nr:MAG: Zn-dependent exopeptidase M28 [bacterium]
MTSDDSVERELRSYIDRLTSVGSDRFIGTRGHRSAFRMIRGLLESWGLDVTVQPFTVEITVPVSWSTEIDFGGGFEKVESLPGLGSQSVKSLEADILSVGHAREEDFESVAPEEGAAHMAKLWKSHETAKISEAARRGASALIWYNDYFDELYSGACDYSLSPIPGISIRKSVAERILERGGGRIRFSLRSRRRRIRCRNLEAGRDLGHGRYALLASHYDSRPHTPGASDDASGVAAMLAFIRGRYDADAALPVRYLFADCEEEGCQGAELYAESLYQANFLREIRAVVNLDAVGWPNLCLIARDREAVMDEDLTRLAGEVIAESGYRPEKVRSKSGKSNHTPFATRGVPTVWYSDYPNYIRHSTIDNAFNIDYPTIVMVMESLRRLFSRLD